MADTNMGGTDDLNKKEGVVDFSDVGDIDVIADDDAVGVRSDQDYDDIIRQVGKRSVEDEDDYNEADYDDEDFYEIGKLIIADRFDSLLANMNDFIKEAHLKKRIFVSQVLLGEAVMDYYADTLRVKDFHKIARTNNQKIQAYTANWLLHRKPLQLKNNSPFGEQCMVNERFVATMIFSKICSSEGLMPNGTTGCDDETERFINFLIYNLTYRKHTSQTLELMLDALIFGASYYDKMNSKTDKGVITC